jgi:dipeptidyl aminopeptidase/acylaminoacyl peptidase
MKTNILFLLITCALCTQINAQTTVTKRPIGPNDVFRLANLSSPKVSPDGAWVAYVLSTVDSTKNKRNADLWMSSWDGTQSIQLTSSPDGESQPRWSPDGKYLSFVSARQGATSAQIWLMDRRGGEGKQLTTLKADLQDYVWSPDGKKIALVIQSADSTGIPKSKQPQPYVLDRYHFKQDVEGYLQKKRSHLYVFEVSTKKLDTLTQGDFEESDPAWSPDGKYLAFVSNRTPEPDKNENTDLWVMEAKPKAAIKQLTTWTGSESSPIWSPDGSQIAYLRSSSPTYTIYDQSILSVVSKDGGEPILLSSALDRPVSTPRWTKDGQSIAVLVSDDRQRYVAQYQVKTKALSKVVSGNRSFNALEAHPNGTWVSLVSEPQLPAEVFAIENGSTRRLTKHQDAFLAPLILATVEGFVSTSKDGTKVSSLLFKPSKAVAGQKLPTILFIHGGPTAQDEWGFDLSRQILAQAGYAVAGINYRGSNGRGLAFCNAISADWGNKEVIDILGAADYLVQAGIADPNKMGIGGWSYGGILTNYTIASDTRFRAAASGAGSAQVMALYGVDQYILQYENELGAPWKNVDKYLKLSYPFLQMDKIKTPTLFLVGEKDFNVPSIGSEQMYQGLRSLGVPTQLIIYPGQFHGITVPSFQKDRFERYIGWFDKYLKN